MDNFIVSARKYRPATFDMVVGQKSITNTLKNAIKNDHLAHAYLFCGPRGVGKTTCARIFAKTINCHNLTENVEACNECESCRSFNENRSYNIHELDAASNNSVDDIRTLIEQVRIPPQIGTHSVYIIDEIHMLSSAAFNAFLKTLEEPPKHAIFVMATTEKHKILPTILSRCQIFDFNRIKIKDIEEQLGYIAQRESIAAEEAALNIIAQKADGGMRDALSYFDQIVSFSGKEITYQNVIANLNVLDYDYYFKLTKAFLEGDHTTILTIFNEILNKGFDSQNFITGLNGHFRDLLVSKDNETVNLLEVGAEIKELYLEQSQQCSPAFIFKALQICNQAEVTFKSSQNQRLHVELALLKICNLSPQSPFYEAPPQAAAPATAETKKKSSEQVKPTVNPNNKPKRAIIPSIKSALGGQTANENSQPESDYKKNQPSIGEDSFNQDKLAETWEKTAESLKSKPRLYAILKSLQPQIGDKNQIKIKTTNIEREAIVENRDEILKILKPLLNNRHIDFIFEDVKVQEKKRLYTNEDKYRYLNEKNQSLEQLRQKFGLDFS